MPRLIGKTGVAAFGASRPLRRIPAIVSFLNPQPALTLVGGNRSSCPKADVADGKRAAIVTALRQAIDRDCYPCRRG